MDEQVSRFKDKFEGYLRDFKFNLAKLDDDAFVFFTDTIRIIIDEDQRGRDAATVENYQKQMEAANPAPILVLGERWGTVTWAAKSQRPRLVRMA